MADAPSPPAQPTAPPAPKAPAADPRPDLAKSTIYFVFGATGVLGLAAIAAVAIKGGDGAVTSIKDVLGLLLPVLGTWAGTVFAFYFSRENFESAAKHSEAMFKQFTSSEEKLKATPVKSVMLDMTDLTKVTVFDLKKDPKTTKLKSEVIDGIMKTAGRERLPGVENGRVKWIAHLSLFNDFIVQNYKTADDLKLQQVLDDPKCKGVLDSFCVVKATQSLADVKAAMDTVKMCADAFVTEDGTKESKVIGWVTDAIVLAACKI